MEQTTVDKTERRKYVRIAKSLPVNLRINSRNGGGNAFSTVCKAVSKNIGAGGILLEMTVPEEWLLNMATSQQSKMEVSISLPGEPVSVKAEAREVWAAEIDEPDLQRKLRMGMEFVHVANDVKNHLSAYIADLAFRAGIKSLLADIARMDETAFDENTSIRDELGVDSLMAMEILAAVEKAYNIQIDEAKVFDVVTVGDVIELIKGYLDK